MRSGLTRDAGHALDDHLYLVDPMGNWMMRFPAELDLAGAARAKRDIERVLRASASWDTQGAEHDIHTPFSQRAAPMTPSLWSTLSPILQVMLAGLLLAALALAWMTLRSAPRPGRMAGCAPPRC